MEQASVDFLIAQNMSKFSPMQLGEMKKKLEQLPDEKIALVASLEFRDTTMMLILSIFLGVWGVDRFLVGDIGIGLLKLLTGGCCGILWIIDIINMKSKTQDYNFKKFLNAVNYGII